MSIADKLALLGDTKAAIKAAIEAKGTPVGEVPFSDYPSKIEGIVASREWSEAYWQQTLDNSYTRPADWLALPEVLKTDQKFVGLHAVFKDANFVALAASGDYVVDWGDGTVEEFPAGAKAEHEYDYATYDTAGATLCSRGYKQAVITVTPQAGESLTSLNLNMDHSAIGARYASGFLDIAVSGQELAALSIGDLAPDADAMGVDFSWLERANIVCSALLRLDRLFYRCISLKSVVNLDISTAPVRSLSATLAEGGVAVLAGHGLRDGDQLYLTSPVESQGLYIDAKYFVVNSTPDIFQLSLDVGGEHVSFVGGELAVFTVGARMGGTFEDCSALQTIPLLNTSNVVDMSSMFGGCYSLQTIPLLDASAVVNMDGMFNNCFSLQTIPLLDTSAVMNMGHMFNGCLTLLTIPLLDTSSVVNMEGMFGDCGLQTVPALDTSAVTNMRSMFSSCHNLQTIPPLDTSTVVNMGNMFSNCRSLQTIPLLDTSSVEDMYYMFAECYGLQTIPLLDTSLVVNMEGVFTGCYSLRSVPALNTSAATNMNYMFDQCSNLSELGMTGAKVSFYVADCKLSSAQLNALYNSLAVVSGEQITVSGNFGAATADSSIATAKGWQVIQ